MLYRDSSVATHWQRGIIAAVDSSHGVRIEGGSTGGIIESVGDDANISITMRGVGTGLTQIGNSSAVVRIGTSTSGIATIQRYLVQYTVPALTSNGQDASNDTVTVTGLTTNSVLVLQPRVRTNSTGYVSVFARCSTANELSLSYVNESGSTLSGSTQSAYLIQIGF